MDATTPDSRGTRHPRHWAGRWLCGPAARLSSVLTLMGFIAACQAAPTAPPPTPSPTPGDPVGLSLRQPADIDQVIASGEWDVRVSDVQLGVSAYRLAQQKIGAIAASVDDRYWLSVDVSIDHARPATTETGADWDYTVFVVYSDGLLREARAEERFAYRDSIAAGGTATASHFVFDTQAVTPVQAAIRIYANADYSWAFVRVPRGGQLPIAPSDDLPTPNSLGDTPETAARLGETLVGQDFAVTLDEVLWGTQAEPVFPGLHHEEGSAARAPLSHRAVFRVTIRIVGRDPVPYNVHSIWFQPAAAETADAARWLDADSYERGLAIPGAQRTTWWTVALDPAGDRLLRVELRGHALNYHPEDRYLQLPAP